MPVYQILADENVPFARELFSSFGEVTTVPGSAITREKVRDTDILIVRSVTHVNASLLQDSSVRFVGSATIGVDHIETEFLHQRGTAFAHAPGSNADSVVEYVVAALLHTACCMNYNLRGTKVGIVGCGNVGERLANRLASLGLAVTVNDPPRADREDGWRPSQNFQSLEEVLEESDIISLHVPLERGGMYPTEHLFDDRRLRSMKPGSWLINTSRGGVVDNEALVDVLQESSLGPDVAVLDVWEGEPAPSPELVALATIATPHIAGYSYDGKLAGAVMVAEALGRHLGRPMKAASVPPAPPASLLMVPDPALPRIDWLHSLVTQMYDIAADHHRMIPLAELDTHERALAFAALRRDYPVRRTFAAYRVPRPMIPTTIHDAIRDGLHVHLENEAWTSSR